jgi:hypothetical protein
MRPIEACGYAKYGTRLRERAEQLHGTAHISVFLHARIEELYEADVYIWRHVTDCHKLLSCHEGQQ